MFGRIHTARIGWHKEKAIFWLLVLTFLLTTFSPIAGGVEGAEIYCPECGTKNDLTSKFCGNCGTLLSGTTATRPVQEEEAEEERNLMAEATFDFGVEAFKKGMYSDAKAAFREVIRKYPNSFYAPGARVWLEATKRAMKQRYVKAASPREEKPSPLRTIVGLGATILLLALIF